MKKEITMEQYVAMCDRYDAAQFQCGAWWPTIREIQTRIEPKVEQNLEFLIWVAETADYPKTPEEQASKNYINKLLRETIVILDDDDERAKYNNDDVETETDDEEEEVE